MTTPCHVTFWKGLRIALVALIVGGCTLPSVTPATKPPSASAAPKPSLTSTHLPLPTQAGTPSPTPLLTVTATTTQPNAQPSPAVGWQVYLQAESRLSFHYPTDWYILEESGYIYLSNQRVDVVQEKKQDERVKIDIPAQPRDISNYPDLKAFVAAEYATDALVSQVPLEHSEQGYEVLEQILTGLMGNPNERYGRLFVSHDGKAVVVMVYGLSQLQLVERIVATLTFP
ncbi:MAG: hypothetical protein Kow0088_11140 [Anaerolineales bacterium]